MLSDELITLCFIVQLIDFTCTQWLGLEFEFNPTISFLGTIAKMIHFGTLIVKTVHFSILCKTNPLF
jgi:hypothetical protein